MSESRRNDSPSNQSKSLTTTTLSSTLMSSASVPQILNFPTNSTLMFAPQLGTLPFDGHPSVRTTTSASSIGTVPFSFITPSGQIFLTAPLPLPSGLPLPYLNTPSLFPHLSSAVQRNSAFPYGILAPTANSNLPTYTPTSHSCSTEPVSEPLLSSAALQQRPPTSQSPVVGEKVAFTAPAVTIPTRRSRSLSLVQLPSFLSSSELDSKGLHLHPESTGCSSPPTPPTLAQPQQTLPSSMMSKYSVRQTRDQESKKGQETGCTASLKQLLAVDHSLLRDPLVEQLQGEADLNRFYKCFGASGQSHQLQIDLLPSQGNGSLKWLQVRQKAFHIDPDLGPVVVARVLVSSNGIMKFQLLFPTYKTVYTKLFVEEDMENTLSELSSDHVICPGLSGYKDKYAVLGYHPSHVRILETAHLKRYDHEHCPIWHVPSGTFSKRDRIVQNMCKQCKYLQNSVVRLATKACEVDPAERESWTDPSSNRPLAYMSAADREERYRKLRQERNQMLVKLRAYEERLGIGE